MHLLASEIEGLPVISLQTSETVAWTQRPLVDMSSLKIIALHCDAQRNQILLLMVRDIRQLASDCIIIDTEDELVEPVEIVRLKHIIEANYEPLGKAVITDTGRKLGIVDNYTISLETSRVQKLYVRPSLFRWLSDHLTIDRAQIIDVTPKQITVKESLIQAPILQTKPIP